MIPRKTSVALTPKDIEYLNLLMEHSPELKRISDASERVRYLCRIAGEVLLAQQKVMSHKVPVEVKNASKVGNFYMFAFVFEGFCHDSSRILKFLILDEFGHCHRGVILFNIDGISWISERFSGVTESLPVFSAEAI